MNNIKVFCDGSCSVHDPRFNGAHCAVIDIPGEKPYAILGGINETTISKMEIKAAAAALVHLLELAQKGLIPAGVDTVELYSDSSYVVGCATGDSKILANKPQWAEFLTAHAMLGEYIKNIMIIKIGRNTEPEAEAADRIAGELRELLYGYRTGRLC